MNKSYPLLATPGNLQQRHRRRNCEGPRWALPHGKCWNGRSVPFSLPKVGPDAPGQTKPLAMTPRTTLLGGAGPAAAPIRSRSIFPGQSLSGAAGPGQGPGQGCLVGSVTAGSHGREPWRSRGRAGVKGQPFLPTSRPPNRPGSLLLPFAPLPCCSPGLASERGKSRRNSWSISLPDNLRTQHLLDMGWTLDFNSAFTPSGFVHSKFGCYSGSWTR